MAVNVSTEYVLDHVKRIRVSRGTPDTMGTTAVSKVPDYRKPISCETFTVDTEFSR